MAPFASSPHDDRDSHRHGSTAGDAPKSSLPAAVTPHAISRFYAWIHQARLVPMMLLVFSLVLVPWMVYLGLSLPARARIQHDTFFWVGFDVGLAVAMGATGWLALKGRREAELTAVATATLLIVDAWLDVTSARTGRPLAAALARALLIELPLAVVVLRAFRARHVTRDAGTTDESAPEEKSRSA